MLGRSRRTFCPMSPLPLGLLIVAAALCCGLVVTEQMAWHAGRTPVLSLATLQSDLQHNPAAWLGRRVRVHAVAVQCQGWLVDPASCFQWQPALVDARDAAAPALPLVADPAPSAPPWLRSLPIIAGLWPWRRPIQWGTPADYMVRVQVRPCAVGSLITCYTAMLQGVSL